MLIELNEDDRWFPIAAQVPDRGARERLDLGRYAARFAAQGYPTLEQLLAHPPTEEELLLDVGVNEFASRRWMVRNLKRLQQDEEDRQLAEHQQAWQQALDLTDEVGRTPLYIAVQHGHAAVVARLLAAGAAVNQAHNNGTTPLYIAAQHGHLRVVQVLLQACDLLGGCAAADTQIAQFRMLLLCACHAACFSPAAARFVRASAA